MPTSLHPPRDVAYQHLLLTDRAGKIHRFPVTAQARVIGRAPDADIRLSHPAISRAHAEVQLGQRGDILVRDLGSANGTAIGDKPINSSWHLLKPGAVLRMGPFELLSESRDILSESLNAHSLNEVLGLDHGKRISAARLEAGHLFALQNLSGRLMAEPNQEERRRMLCALFVHAPFPTHCQASILARPCEAPGLPPEFIMGPISGVSLVHAQPVDCSDIEANLRMTWGPVKARVDIAQDHVLANRGPSVPTEHFAVVAAPINEDCYFQLVIPARHDHEGWLALVALAAGAFNQTEVHWQIQETLRQHAALEMDLASAAALQQAILPKNRPLPGIQHRIHFNPCHGVAGDYVDAIPTRDGRVLLVVADVCGKGVKAALVAAFLHTFLHAGATIARPLGNLMDDLNEYLCETLPEGNFVTLAAALWNPHTQEIESTNAGHPPPLVGNANGTVRQLACPAHLPLGLAQTPYATRMDHLTGHDTLLLYTDGLTETTHRTTSQMLGVNGLATLLAGLAGKSLEDLDWGLGHAMNRLRGDVRTQDDQTYMLVRPKADEADMDKEGTRCMPALKG